MWKVSDCHGKREKSGGWTEWKITVGWMLLDEEHVVVLLWLPITSDFSPPLSSLFSSHLLILEEKMWPDASLAPTHSFCLLPRSLSLSFGDIIVRTVMDVQPDNGKHVKKSTSQKLEDQKKVKCCSRLLSCRWRCGRTCLFVYLPIFIPLLHWSWRSWLNCSCTVHRDCTMGAGLSGVGGAGFLAGYFSID